MNFLDKITLNPPVPLKKGIAYPFIEMANVGSYQREPENVDTKVYSSGSRFADGDTIIARITPCLQNGKGFYCHNIGEGFGSTEFIVLRPKDQTVDSRYLYYLMQTNYIREKMIKSMVGASGTQRVNNDVFTSIDISFPKIEIQRRIADILSAYDDLIENNRKQIKLLEEAAQRLYKEWFVDLRFPGYEHTKITDGVPEGWKIDLLSNIVKTTSGGTPARSHPEYYINGSTLWVKTQELLDAFILDTEEKITDEAITNSSTKLVSKGSILMAMYGATIGKLGIASQDLTCNQACCVFDVSGFKYGGMYLFCWLFENRKFLIKLGKGVAQSNLSQTMIKNLNILIPDMNVLHQFSCIVDSLYSEILANQKRITILSEARDRLLPKLMSGEVEV